MGEERLAEDNYELGKVQLEKLPWEVAGSFKVLVKFEVDLNRVLKVTAHLKDDQTNAA